METYTHPNQSLTADKIHCWQNTSATENMRRTCISRKENGSCSIILYKLARKQILPQGDTVKTFIFQHPMKQ